MPFVVSWFGERALTGNTARTNNATNEMDGWKTDAFIMCGFFVPRFMPTIFGATWMLSVTDPRLLNFETRKLRFPSDRGEYEERKRTGYSDWERRDSFLAA